MTREPYVLVLSTIADVATDDVVRRLAAKGIPHRRLNTEDFPFSRTLSHWPAKLDGHGWIEVDDEVLCQPTAIWYRRLRIPSKPENMDAGIYDFCMQENRATLLGSIMGAKARWMSHPAAIWRSEFKPLQLTLAEEIGLAIPRTVITNDAEAIREAFETFGPMIVKPVRSGYVCKEGQEFSIFTSELLEEHLFELDSAHLSPAIYQARVPKRYDLRITIVEHRIFSAAIDSQSDPAAVVDWRSTTNPKLPHHRIDLPTIVSERLMNLMDVLELKFGAVDMVLTPDGDYVFLEINPSGQWLWLDDIVGLGISDSVAAWLAGEEP